MKWLLRRAVNGTAIGAGDLIGRVRSRRIVLCYHRLGRRSSAGRAFPFEDAAVGAGQFEAQLEWLSSFADFVSLGNLFGSGVADGAKLRVAVTFDDGYLSQWRRTVPVLERLGASATWFVPTQFVEQPRRPPWWVLADTVVERVRDRVRLPNAAGEEVYDLREPTDRRRFRSDAAARCRSDPEGMRHEVVDALFGHLDDRMESGEEQLFVDQEQLREAEWSSPLEVGGHTATHPDLTSLSEAALAREVEGAREWLRERVDGRVRWFAYPFGDRAAYDDRVVRAVRRAGFEGAVTCRSDYVGRDTGRHRVPRLTVQPAWDLQTFRAWVLGMSVWRSAARVKQWIDRLQFRFDSESPEKSPGGCTRGSGDR